MHGSPTVRLKARPGAVADFRTAVANVTRSRYIQPHTLVGGSCRRAERKVKAWDLYRTIWRPRLELADSADLYESEQVKDARMRDVDWKQAMCFGAVRHIMRYDDDADVDLDGDGVSDEAQEVVATLLRHERLIYCIFTHYASLVPSVDTLSLPAWRCLYTDLGLVVASSKASTKEALDSIFTEADGMRRRAVKAGARTAPPALLAGPQLKLHVGRAEFLVSMIKLAVNQYVLSGRTSDVSEAVDTLFTAVRSHQRPHGTLLAADPDEFRQRHAYQRLTCDVLERHEEALRACFEFGVRLSSSTPSSVEWSGQLHKWIASRQARSSHAPSSDATKPAAASSTATSSTASSTATSQPMMMSAEGWMALVRTCRLSGDDLSESDALRCFLWSRMLSVDDPTSRRGRPKETAVPFEGFMECLAHLAALKALPSEDELALSGYADAGEYLLTLQATDPTAHSRFVRERRRGWSADLPTDLPRRLELTISLVHASIKRHEGRGLAAARKT